jgi:hypothetical protein
MGYHPGLVGIVRPRGISPEQAGFLEALLIVGSVIGVAFALYGSFTVSFLILAGISVFMGLVMTCMKESKLLAQAFRSCPSDWASPRFYHSGFVTN